MVAAFDISGLQAECDLHTSRRAVPELAACVHRLRQIAADTGDERVAAYAFMYDGFCLMYQGRFDEAMEQYERALPLMQRLEDARGVSRVMLNIGRVHRRRDELELASSWMQQALDIELEVGDGESMYRLMGNITDLFVEMKRIDDVLKMFDLCAAALERRDMLPDLVDVLNMMANFVMLHRSDFDKSLKIGFRALEIATSLGDKARQAKVCTDIGGAYWYTGDAGLSIEYSMRAVYYAEEASEPTIQVSILTNAAFAYQLLDDYNTALQLNRQALHVCEEHQLGFLAGWAEMGVGHALLRLGDPVMALEHDRRAIALLERAEDTHGLGYAHARASQAYAALERWDEAYEECVKALEKRRSNQTELEVAESLADFGGLLVRRGEYDQAMQHLHAALEIADKLQSRAVVYAVHRSLADLHAALGDHGRAMEHLLTYVAVRDEVQMTESARKAQGVEHLHRQELMQREQLATEAILNNVLPRSVSERLKAGHVLIADTIPAVSVMFIDIVGFTPLAAQLTAEELVTLLAHIFGHFDAICTSHGLEKIKTIGDSYMAVAGAPDPCDDHALRCVRAAIDMMRDFPLPPHVLPVSKRSHDLAFRIGIHTGSAVAGVIGERRIAYDLWGDAVNMAARMESHGEAGRIHVSHDIVREVQRLVPNTQQHEPSPFTFLERGEMEIKGKGAMRTYFVSAR